MGTKAQDTFTEASDTDLDSHTPDTGVDWTSETASTFTVRASDDLVIATTAVAEMAREGTNIDDDDMDVSLKYDEVNAFSTREGGPCGRMTTADFDNAYQALLQALAFAFVNLKLWKEVGGSRTELGSFDMPDELTSGVIKLEIRTATKKVFMDGVERISSTDDSLAGNQFAGFYYLNNALGNLKLDDFLSEDVVAVAGEQLFMMGRVT